MTEETHTWDNGEEGNYWDNYNGTDANGDGVGDTPYLIDVLNMDRYPLMQSYVAPPKVAAKVPIETVGVVAFLLAIVIVSIFVVRKRRGKA
jgi:hypothetical protein